jgi:hypothetical protein
MAQQNAGNAMNYVNHNQVDNNPYKLHSIAGIAKDPGDVALQGVMIGLFTDPDHVLMATTETDSKGEFTLAHVSPGRYRIVAKYDFFCPANALVLIQGRGIRFSRKVLEFHMGTCAIDTCSFSCLR